MRKFENEDGFTIIELLVVILIIGIVAAVSVAVFLNQRQIANDAVVVSDTKNLALIVETYIANNKTATSLDINVIRPQFKKSSGVNLLLAGPPNDFCIKAWHDNGKLYKNDNNWSKGRPYYLYSSKLGGGGTPQGLEYNWLSCTSGYGSHIF